MGPVLAKKEHGRDALGTGGGRHKKPHPGALLGEGSLQTEDAGAELPRGRTKCRGGRGGESRWGVGVREGKWGRGESKAVGRQKRRKPQNQGMGKEEGSGMQGMLSKGRVGQLSWEHALLFWRSFQTHRVQLPLALPGQVLHSSSRPTPGLWIQRRGSGAAGFAPSRHSRGMKGRWEAARVFSIHSTTRSSLTRSRPQELSVLSLR